MKNEFSLSGHAMIGEELEVRPVEIQVEDGMITAIDDIARPGSWWICPAFFNAHTHLGDTIAMDCPVSGDLAELVAPPHGLKHRLLASVSHTELISGMRASIDEMVGSGTAGFADFREGGEEGVQALREALIGITCEPVIFGRDGGERIAEGFGVSSTRDVPDIEEQVSAARRTGKLIAIHAGERDPNDLDTALSYDPDLLIHCTHATRTQLRECAGRGIPVVVCPRSNWRLGVAVSATTPDIREMIDLGIPVLLGTDNVMFVQPDMLRELSFTEAVYRIPPRELLRAAIRGSGLFGEPFFIEEGSKANFFVVDPARSNIRFSRDSHKTLVNRVSPEKIVKKVFNS
jgi:cytosine/adenosine deaminase-related metal-dependent hydrolase